MTKAFILQPNGTKRYLDWDEINQLKKDILWNFDENGTELFNSFLPEGTFDLSYWEYLSVEGGEDLGYEETTFYRVGSLILVLTKIAEYIDIPGGNQNSFGGTPFHELEWYVRSFQPADPKQSQLMEAALLGLSIAKTITQEDISDNDDYQHRNIGRFVDQLHWVEQTFVLAYYRSKLV
jgi:hypothetical protein